MFPPVVLCPEETLRQSPDDCSHSGHSHTPVLGVCESSVASLSSCLNLILIFIFVVHQFPMMHSSMSTFLINPLQCSVLSSGGCSDVLIILCLCFWLTVVSAVFIKPVVLFLSLTNRLITCRQAVIWCESWIKSDHRSAVEHFWPQIRATPLNWDCNYQRFGGFISASQQRF